MAKSKSKKTSAITQFFTSNEYSVLNQMKFIMESLFYTHYIQNPIENVDFFGVRSSVVETQHLEKSNLCPIYDKYVDAAKASSVEFSINLEFLAQINEPKLKGDIDEL